MWLIGFSKVCDTKQAMSLLIVFPLINSNWKVITYFYPSVYLKNQGNEGNKCGVVWYVKRWTQSNISTKGPSSDIRVNIFNSCHVIAVKMCGHVNKDIKIIYFSSFGITTMWRKYTCQLQLPLFSKKILINQHFTSGDTLYDGIL